MGTQGLSCSHWVIDAGSPLSVRIELQTFKDSSLASSSPGGRREREGMFHGHLLSLRDLPKFPQVV